jgi:hypothetical protein
LIELWNTCKNLFEELELEINKLKKEQLIHFENNLKEFNELDKRSDSFRYPIDKNGNLFFKSQNLINMENFFEQAHEMKVFLQAIEFDLILTEH